MTMSESEVIKVIKSECYVFNPLNFDRTQLINTALDAAVEALEQVKEIKGIIKDKRYIQEDVLKYKMIEQLLYETETKVEKKSDTSRRE